jgi:Membrane proteins related to metalloendopeptidases
VKNVKYTYNPATQQFEPYHLPWWKKLLRVFMFLSAAVVTAGLIIFSAFWLMQSPKEKLMNRQLALLQEKYDLIKKELQELNSQVASINQRDEHIYQAIFESKPPKAFKSIQTFDSAALEKKLSPLNNNDLLTAIDAQINAIKQKLLIQQRNFDTLERLVVNKQEMLMSIPSIQPISNKELYRIASGFGARIDPIYKIEKFHAGLDFTAPIGTPIYATGDGVVEEAAYHDGGYGYHIWIRHGFGYRSHYAHMIKLKAKSGQKVKRGDVIGWVGSTGKSTGPHCHYEVEKNGEKLDPVHFFYNDIKPEEFEQMIKLAQVNNQSLD